MKLQDRIALLESEVRRLSALADQAPERQALVGQPRSPRWAVTCIPSGESSYPAIGDRPNCYGIIFCDATYTQTQGAQTKSDTDRQTTGAAVAYVHDDPSDSDFSQYIPQDTPVLVHWDNARWWILPPRPRLEQFELLLDSFAASSSIPAELIDYGNGGGPKNIRLYLPHHQGVGRVGETNQAGTLGYCKWEPARQRWEAVAGLFKTISAATCDDVIKTGWAGYVTLYWNAYFTRNVVAGGGTLEAVNWMLPDLPAGTKVIVGYDRQENGAYILDAGKAMVDEAIHRILLMG